MGASAGNLHRYTHEHVVGGAMERVKVSELEPGGGPLDQDTVRLSRCGCVPQLSLVYEDVQQGKSAPSWARRIPLFGPLWCVSGATGTSKVRRR